ncbi:MAG: hypothetical protein IJ555_12940 [Ruminococcus sp.]|nr:hypothetical protein [Ruminococcus sp.]MBR1751125.1 hypothetical protein [Ruminococcus sp.]
MFILLNLPKYKILKTFKKVSLHILRNYPLQSCDYLLLDYPFAYEHKILKEYIDCCIFIDTPLDIALARRVFRDMKASSADDIRNEMDSYLKYARPAFVHMQKTTLPDSDYVIDGGGELEAIVTEIFEYITGGE